MEKSKYEQAKSEILEWINYVATPQQKLSNFPICPFAKKALKDNKYRIVFFDEEVGGDFFSFVEREKNNWNDDLYEIKLLVSVENNIPHDVLKSYCEKRSLELKTEDFFMISEHPDRKIELAGISTRLNRYPMIFLQRRGRLNSAYEMLKKGDYYSHWNKELFDEIVSSRLD